MAIALAVACAGCGTAKDPPAPPAGAGAAPPLSGSTAATTAGPDWPTFGLTPSRPSATSAATGITAGNVRRLRRHVVRLPGTVDSAPIYLRSAVVHGHRRAVAFMTTTYGRTVAVSTAGRILWT